MLVVAYEFVGCSLFWVKKKTWPCLFLSRNAVQQACKNKNFRRPTNSRRLIDYDGFYRVKDDGSWVLGNAKNNCACGGPGTTLRKKCFWMMFLWRHVLLYIQSINEVTKELLLVHAVKWPRVVLCCNNVIRSSFMVCWKYFTFFSFLNAGIVYREFADVIYFTRWQFKPNENAAANFLKEQNKYTAKVVLHTTPCSSWRNVVPEICAFRD